MRYIIEHCGEVLEFKSFDDVHSFFLKQLMSASRYENGTGLFWVDFLENAPLEKSVDGMREVLNRGEAAFIELRSADGSVRDCFDLWTKFGYDREKKIAEQEQLA